MVFEMGTVHLWPNLNIFELHLSRLWTVKLGKENDKGLGSVCINSGERHKVDL